jgi:uncharacterized protein YjbJ (UPF0337 family)
MNVVYPRFSPSYFPSKKTLCSQGLKRADKFSRVILEKGEKGVFSLYPSGHVLIKQAGGLAQVLAISVFYGGLTTMDDTTRQQSQGSNSAARDKVEGSMREAGGRVKESMGALSGDERLKAEGQRDQVAGTARRKKGTLKDRIKGWINRF